MTPNKGGISSPTMDDWLLDFNAKIPDQNDPDRVEALKNLRMRLSSAATGWQDALDERHLLKFLRYTKFQPAEAFAMLRTIQKDRLAYPDLILPVGKGPRDYAHVYGLRCVEVLRHRNPRDGSAVVILRLGDWTPETGVDFRQAQSAAAFLADVVLEDERIQRDGVTLILDCRGLRLSHLINFLPLSSVPNLVKTIQDGSPVHFSGVHILNQPMMYKVIFKIAWPFIKKESRDRIHFHDTKIDALHEFLPRAILPHDLLGQQQPDFDWIAETMYSRHDDYVARSKFMPTGS